MIVGEETKTFQAYKLGRADEKEALKIGFHIAKKTTLHLHVLSRNQI